MEAIRDVQTVKNGAVHLQLPQQFWGQEVEIIVLPAPRVSSTLSAPKKSLRGSLKSFANPDWIEQEGDAWQAVVGEKHEPR
jgi:hypothetical protein